MNRTRQLNTAKKCSVPTCESMRRCGEFCGAHYSKWRKYGDPTAQIATTANGAAAEFLEKAKIHRGSECLVWPFYKDARGYGRLRSRQNLGTSFVHRTICWHRHGAPPSPEHSACHNCNNSSCVNGDHLRWDTRVGNMQDKFAAGTMPLGERVFTAKLKADDIPVIRALHGKVPQHIVAQQFGVTREQISSIQRRKAWRHIS